MLTLVSDAPVRAGVIALGWVPQVVDELAVLRLQAVALTEQRDAAMVMVAALTTTNQAAWERVRALEGAQAQRLARIAAHPRVSLLGALCGTVTLGWFTAWGWFETPQSRRGEVGA